MFSEEELILARDPEVMLTKNAVIRKVCDLFGLLSGQQSEVVRQSLPVHGQALDLPAKISKGEQYLGLPYVILDYPRIFRHADIFAIRTMFWWGHFFSVTLHLKGDSLSRLREGLCLRYSEIVSGGMYVCISEEEWEHHFGPENYRLAGEIHQDEWSLFLSSREFVKLAFVFPIDASTDMAGQLMLKYRMLLQLLGSA